MKNKKEEIKEKIVEILKEENRGMSIREVKLALDDFDMSASGAIVSKYLRELKEEKKIVEE
jgi:arginine repressor